jgi:lysophospholipase L1-like esterase
VSLRVRFAFMAARVLGKRPVVLIGDSRFDQLGSAGLGSNDELVVCAGVAGATARVWSSVLATTGPSARPATFVVWLGVNDLVNEGTTARATVRHLQAIADQLAQGAQPRVLLLEQIPVRLPASPEAERIAVAVDEINRALAAIAQRDARVELVPLWTRFGGGAAGGSDPCKDCYADALHLSEHGDRVLRELLDDALRRKP